MSTKKISPIARQDKRIILALFARIIIYRRIQSKRYYPKAITDCIFPVLSCIFSICLGNMIHMTLNKRTILLSLFAPLGGQKRQPRGAQLVEFSAALVLLITGIIIPLLDLSVLPLHWILSQEIINSEVRKLAQSENFGSAIAALDTDSSLRTQLTNLGGVKPLSTKCALVISMLNKPYEFFTVEEPQSILREWLPEGKRSPCYYELEISTVLELSPLVVLDKFSISVPGLTRPFICTIKARAHWENYGRDPVTKKFYMNE